MRLPWSKKDPKTTVSDPSSGRNTTPGDPISGGDLTGEFAVRKFQRELMSLLTVLPNPDPILRSERIQLPTYRAMVDGHLGAVTRKRRAAVRSRPWILEANGADSRSTARVMDCLKTLSVRSILTRGWNALPYGYAVQETVWGDFDDGIFPVKVLDKPQEWFGWHVDSSFRFVDDMGLGQLVPPCKFLVTRNEPDTMNPYGKPLLSECFWPLAFKRGGLQFWMTFLEKYGMPRIVGKVPAGTSEFDRDRLLSALVGMVRDAAIVINDNQTIDLQESQSKSTSADAYSSLVRWADTEISKAILGETLSTELGTVGSLAAAEVHNDVRKDLAQDDATMLESMMNELIGWIYDLNWPTQSIRPEFKIQMPEDLKSGRVARDKELTAMMMQSGNALSSEYFSTTYDIDPKYIVPAAPSTSSARPAIGTGAMFAEAPEESWRPDHLSQALAAKLQPKEIQDQQQELVGRIMEFAQQEDGFPGFLEFLETQFPSIPTPQLESMVSQFHLLGELAGRSDMQETVQQKLDS